MQLNKVHYRRRRGKSTEAEGEISVRLGSAFKNLSFVHEILNSGLEKCSLPARMYCFLHHKYQCLKMKVCQCVNCTFIVVQANALCC